MTLIKEKTPALRRLGIEASVAPPEGSQPYCAEFRATVSGRGVLMSGRLVYTDPASRPGWAAKDEVGQVVYRLFVPTRQRPNGIDLLRAASHAAWGMSTLEVVTLCDGQYPLPGL